LKKSIAPIDGKPGAPGDKDAAAPAPTSESQSAHDILDGKVN